jgi:hypothetical protein
MNLQLLSFLIMCLFAAPLTPSEGARQSPSDEAVVTGTVTDVDGGRINGARVRVTDGDHVVRVQTTTNGDYAVHLTPGVYTVSVDSSGFCRSRRSAFSLKPGAHAKFDFELTVCGTMDPFFPGQRAEDPYPELPKVRQPGQYGEEELKAIGPAGLRPLVMYGERQEGPESISYSSLIINEFNDTRMPVVYSYDLLTIRCDHLIYLPKDNSIEASGNVVWQDRSETRRGSKLSLSFRDGEPIVSLTP